MDAKGTKVFLASAFGALIGAAVALQLSPWFAWIGAIVGGALGYLSYDWREVMRAIPRAWKATMSEVGAMLPKNRAELGSSLGLIVAGLSWGIPAAFFHYFATLSLITSVFEGSVFGAIGAIVGIGAMCTALIASPSTNTPGLTLIDLRNAPDLAFGKLLWRVSMPTVLLWHLPKAMVIGGILCIVCFIIALPSFVWRVFIEVHSEMRLICGADAALGAFAGYFAGSALIGGLVGGILGVLNYELVTKRLLIPRGLVTVRERE